MGWKIGAAAITAVTLGFVWGLGWLAYGFLSSGTPLGIGVGVGIAILTPISLWTILREVRFGIATQRLGRAEAREDFLSSVDLGDFPGAKAQAEAEPENWRAWYRLAIAYDLNRDRRAARAAMRQALRSFGSDTAR